MDYDNYYCIGTKEEVMNFSRILDFEKDDIGSYYNILIPEYKKCVYNVINKLIGNKDFFGYNLKCVLSAFKNSSSKISQFSISRNLYKDAEMYFDKINYENFIDHSKTAKDIDNQLICAKKTVQVSEVSEIYEYAQTICKYFMIDINLLTTGIGNVYSIKDNWFDKYYNDTEFHKLAEKEVIDTWNTLGRVTRYDRYLKERKEININDTIIEKEWAVITHSGAYLILKTQKGLQNELHAIEQLIHELHACQLILGNMPFN